MCKVPSLVFMILLGSGSLLLAGPSSYKGPNPCTLAKGSGSPVDKACQEGGIDGAKAKMKELVQQGRAAGVKHDCDDCHDSDDADDSDHDYSTLISGAEERFKKLIAAIEKKKP